MATYIKICFHGAGRAWVAAAATIVVGDRPHFAIPVYPKHNFVGVIVVPDIERRVIGPRAWAVHAKCGGYVGHAADCIVNVVVNVGIGFDTASVGMIGCYTPIPFIVGP